MLPKLDIKCQLEDSQKTLKLLIYLQEIFLSENFRYEAIKMDEILSGQYFNLSEFELSIQKGKKFIED